MVSIISYFLTLGLLLFYYSLGSDPPMYALCLHGTATTETDKVHHGTAYTKHNSLPNPLTTLLAPYQEATYISTILAYTIIPLQPQVIAKRHHDNYIAMIKVKLHIYRFKYQQPPLTHTTNTSRLSWKCRRCVVSPDPPKRHVVR